MTIEITDEQAGHLLKALWDAILRKPTLSVTQLTPTFIIESSWATRNRVYLAVRSQEEIMAIYNQTPCNWKTMDVCKWSYPHGPDHPGFITEIYYMSGIGYFVDCQINQSYFRQQEACTPILPLGK